MSTVLRIFWRDLRRILANPVAVVVTIGVAIIPSLYAWFNILANWDPYENTSTVPIAVAILDEGADIEGVGPTNAGDMIRERLEDNDQLGWTFTSEDEAVEGVRAGTYYAAFVVPADFTASLADVMDGDANPAHVAYYVNEKVNAISPKVADTGSTTLESQISSQFVSVVGEVVTEKLQQAVDAGAASIDGATADTARDLRTVEGLLDELATSLDGSQPALDATRTAISSARQTLKDLSGTSDTLAQSLDTAMGNLRGTRTGAGQLVADLSAALGNASSTLSGISSSASYDIGALAGDVGWAQGKLDAAIAQIRALNGTVQTLKGSLEDVRTTIVSLKLGELDATLETQLTSGIDAEVSVLVQLSDEQLARLDELQALSDSLAAGVEGVRNLSTSVNDAIQTSTNTLGNLQRDLSATTLPALSGALDSFSDVGGRLVGAAGGIAPLLNQADATLAQLDAIIEQCKTTVGSTSSSLGEAGEKVGALAGDVEAVQSAYALEAVQGLLDLDPEEVGTFMGAPAALVDEAVFPVSNYGSGVAPFYTNLALWVGGFVLVAIYKLEVDAEGIGAFAPWQGFFGRWLLLALVGQVQAIICCVGDVLLGIQCLSPAAYVFAGMVESFVYVLVVYSLAIAFKHMGKALGVLLVVLQIPGTAGVYPIEMMPDFFQALHPWLPFTYGIDAMREAVAGFYGNAYAANLGVLLLFCVPALLIGVAARRHLLNINALFDRRLTESDLMISERDGLAGARPGVDVVMRALLESDEHRAAALARAARFELAYPRLVRAGLVALVAVPACLLALLWVFPHQFALLVLWIVSLVATCAFLVVVEYLHSRVTEKDALSRMSRAELHALIDAEQKGADAR